MKQFLVLVVCAVSFAWCAHDLSSYPFKITLNPAKNGAGLYELYWNFDNAEETISFAVRVQTTGWVGFGLSPNGQMPNSDVVIGWVTDEGQTEFQVSQLKQQYYNYVHYSRSTQDRFATGRFLPAVDRQQNWILKGGEEENGFTILEFSRKYVTCDQNDLPITVSQKESCCVRKLDRKHHIFTYRLKQPGLFGVSIMPLTFHLDDTLARGH